MSESDNPESPAESSYVLVARDYADIAHLENPSVIERILSRTRTEKVAYVSALLTSGMSRYALAGPKVALTAMAVEALTDFGKEVSRWITEDKIPKDFSSRPSGYQTWVELLREIDSDPVDLDRLKAMKAMFLAANRITATDGESMVAYQLFQIAKKLNSGELLLLNAIFKAFRAKSFPQGALLSQNVSNWRSVMANNLGHGLSSLIRQQERTLAEYNLITPIVMSGQLETIVGDPSRLSDFGIKFCENIETYHIEAELRQKPPE
jgi:hypothetical protein